MAIFAKIANFAKIASLQGATFGIQFKSPAAGDFSPVSPFSPLHAFLDISETPEAEGIHVIKGMLWWVLTLTRTIAANPEKRKHFMEGYETQDDR